MGCSLWFSSTTGDLILRYHIGRTIGIKEAQSHDEMVQACEKKSGAKIPLNHEFDEFWDFTMKPLGI